MESPDLVSKNIEKISELFPEVITEVEDADGLITKAVDFDKLKFLLTNGSTEDKEKYSFGWPGKKEALKNANSSIRKTLRPSISDSINWDGTQNLYIEGDNLEVLKLLQESYLGKVKIIYIDPPYNTGKDFIYNDKYSMDPREYSDLNGSLNEDGERLFLNTESNGRYHSDWCSMIYSRLLLARNLLSDDGVIFISISDKEIFNLGKICDEVFGEQSFVCSAIWRSSDNSNNDSHQFSNDHNYTLIYSKSPNWQPKKLYDETKRTHFKNPDNDPNGPWFDGNPVNSPNYRENLRYEIKTPNGNVISPPPNGWRWSRDTLEQKMKSGEIYFNADQTRIKRRTYLKDMKGLPPSTLWTNLNKTGHNRQAKYELLSLLPEDVFDTPKPTKLIKYIINLVENNENSIVMDFFSGSGTTADAVMQLNSEDGGKRRFILVQLPEDLDISYKNAANDKKKILKNAIDLCDSLGAPHTLSEVAKERIRRVGNRLVDHGAKADLGFRVLKLSDSNMKDVYYSPDRFQQDLLSLTESNIKEDRTDLDLLFGCLLEWGLELSKPYNSEEIAGVTVHTYDGDALVACFADNIPEEVVREIAKRQPLRAVFRDSSFGDDAARVNLGEIFKLLSPDTEVKVL